MLQDESLQLSECRWLTITLAPRLQSFTHQLTPTRKKGRYIAGQGCKVNRCPLPADILSHLTRSVCLYLRLSSELCCGPYQQYDFEDIFSWRWAFTCPEQEKNSLKKKVISAWTISSKWNQNSMGISPEVNEISWNVVHNDVPHDDR